MGRNKKKGHGGGPGISKKMSEGSRGERLRKREEERAIKRANKRRRLGKKPLEVDRSGGHEGRVKKHANKRRLELARLERLVSKQEELLRNYRAPVQVTPLDPELKRKRRRRDFYDLDTSHWQLKGAARPADSLPGAGGTELVDERGDWEPGEDLFEKLGGVSAGDGGGSEDDSADSNSDESRERKEEAKRGEGVRSDKVSSEAKKRPSEGGFYEGPEACREYLDLNHQLAQRLHESGKDSQTHEALKRYQRSLELDPVDHVKARRGLARLLLDAGEADKARAVIDRFPDDRGCELAWSLAAIEFVAWSVLQEEGSGEEVADRALHEACRANTFVAWNIAHREIFDEVVEHADEIESPPEGSVREAFWYMVREGGLWESLEGSSDWVAGFLLRNEMLPPNPHEDIPPSGANEGVSEDDEEEKGDDRKADGNSGGGGGRRKRGRRVDEDNSDDNQDEVSAARNKSKEEGGDAGMFANMFETAVGMAAEMAEEQMGGGDEEGGGDDDAEGAEVEGEGGEEIHGADIKGAPWSTGSGRKGDREEYEEGSSSDEGKV